MAGSSRLSGKKHEPLRLDKLGWISQIVSMNALIALEIEALLRAALSPTRIEVINDSARHHGHAGDDGSGESHLTVVIESDGFAGRSEEHTSELQSIMRTSYAVFCLTTQNSTD